MVAPHSNAKSHMTLIVIQALLAVANTISNSFALVFLLRADFSYAECGLFILIMAAVAAPSAIVLFRFVTSRLKASMMLGLGVLTMFYLAFVTLQGYALFSAASVLMGVYIVLFWVPYNILIMRVSPLGTRGAIVGIYFLVFPAVAVLGPLLGGSIIDSLGYDVVFILAAAVLAANVLFVALSKVDAKAGEPAAKVTRPEPLRLGDMSGGLRRALFFEGIQDGVFWIYPSIVGFEFAHSELSLGTMLSLFALAGASMTVALGFASDRIKNRGAFLVAGALLAAAFCALTAFASDTGQFIVYMSIVSLFLAVVPSFLFTMTVDEMENRMEVGSSLREVLLNAGRVLGALACIIIALAFGNMRYAIVIAGIALIAVVLSRPGRQSGKSGTSSENSQ